MASETKNPLEQIAKTNISSLPKDCILVTIHNDEGITSIEIYDSSGFGKFLEKGIDSRCRFTIEYERVRYSTSPYVASFYCDPTSSPPILSLYWRDEEMDYKLIEIHGSMKEIYRVIHHLLEMTRVYEEGKNKGV